MKLLNENEKKKMKTFHNETKFQNFKISKFQK